MTDTLPTLADARSEAVAFLRVFDPNNEMPGWHMLRRQDGEQFTLGALRALLLATNPPDLSSLGTGARRGDPATSHEAFDITSVSATAARGKILLAFAKDHLRGWDGLTSDAACRTAHVSHQRAPWKRVSDLKLAQLIEPTGETVNTMRGSRAEKLRITEKGMDVLRRSLPDELAEIEKVVG